MFLAETEITDLHKKLINGEKLPNNFPFINALSDSKEIFVVVHECRIDRLPNGKFKNFFAGQKPDGDNRIWCIERCEYNNHFKCYMTSCCPVPDSFKIIDAKFDSEKLILKSEDNKTIGFEMFQWTFTFGFFGSSKTGKLNEIFTEEELEHDFYNLPNVQKAAEKPKPKTKKRSYISVSNMGRMNYNENLEVFETVKNSVRFTIEDEHSEKTLKISKDILKEIYDDLENFTNKIKIYAAEKLLKAKNDSWLEEGEKPLTTEEFTRRITLSEVNVSSENITVYFDDDDIFWGHTIAIFANAKCSFTSADILG